jgi:hypothetical protein
MRRMRRVVVIPSVTLVRASKEGFMTRALTPETEITLHASPAVISVLRPASPATDDGRHPLVVEERAPRLRGGSLIEPQSKEGNGV